MSAQKIHFTFRKLTFISGSGPFQQVLQQVMELYCLNDLLFMEGHLVSVNNCDGPFSCGFFFLISV